MSAIIFTLGLLASLTYANPGIDEQLIGGRAAKDGEFPEVVYVSFGSGRCTGSVIGPRVLLSAAHCMRNGSGGSFQLNQTQYKVSKCTHHPDYRRKDVDIAVCLIEKEVDTAFAVIPEEGFELKKGNKITITGYGCIRPGGGGGNDGILRVGDAEIRGTSGYDLVSYGKGLCFGDSGGPAYTQMDDGFLKTHYQVSVNSKGNIKDTNYTAPTYKSQARDLFKDFIKKNNVEICGINKECSKDQTKCFEERSDYNLLVKIAAQQKDVLHACQDLK